MHRACSAPKSRQVDHEGELVVASGILSVVRKFAGCLSAALQLPCDVTHRQQLRWYLQVGVRVCKCIEATV